MGSREVKVDGWQGAGMLESMCLAHTKERKEQSEGEPVKRAKQFWLRGLKARSFHSLVIKSVLA